MKNKKYVWVVKNDKQEIITRTDEDNFKEKQSVYYGKLIDIVKIITFKEWKEMATIEIYNNSFDKVNHKPITKDELEKILDEAK